ncbi:MAG: hypothetical protein ACT4TC_22720 [Myxococcaceae bacterium]
MSGVFASGVATVYVAAVVGIHRLSVSRRRAQSQGFPTLKWLDWDALLTGLLPESKPGAADRKTATPVLGGGPPPDSYLNALFFHPTDLRVALVTQLLGGATADGLGNFIAAAGISGGQARWIRTLAYARHEPERAIERLKSSTIDSAQELYLREYLRLQHHLNPLNLELAVFAAKRRLRAGLLRFGEVPALYYARALASAELGMNHAAIDDLARAVYFSRQSELYVRAVLETPFIEEARPPLVFQCRQALDRPPPLS